MPASSLQLGPRRPLLLLGPQRPVPNITEALATLPGEGPVVTITAGWRHDEADHAALHEAVGAGAVSLPLYAWFDEVMREEPELAAAYKSRQAQLKHLKRLHRMRQHPALDAVKKLLDQADRETHLVRPQLLWALEDVRRIDEQLIRQANAIREAHRSVARTWEHPRVAARRQEAIAVIRDARAVCIAGGHVAVLRNRLRFFGMPEVIRQSRAVVAWSAGAMVLTSKIVLFYDDPPEGSSHAEVLDDGFGFVEDCVLLPHAARRLRIHEPPRVSLLATRFSPSACIGMENGAWLDRAGGRWINRGKPGAATLLGLNGSVAELDEGEV